MIILIINVYVSLYMFIYVFIYLYIIYTFLDEKYFIGKIE